ncbi:DUF6165 family protein [Fluviispira multicolorata]|uniref:Uncharacterized protein n=1 Tax=Fluviispira multicolorata TaxID=2654512 RepID=A0A833N2U0_9BACT|nr:DUF6165 family protein [Fluviispira multicolorata]KAB8028606.1 hypothetical protein GCL57_12875 [Fluviispira multicolorata]
MSEVFTPISIGELLDKITILQIKSSQIKDTEKLVNINKELSLLVDVCVKNKIDTNDKLVHDLKRHNEALWEIEDQIRDKERAKEFDEEFIRLARAVYYTNDKRADVKKQINLKSGSALVEEKSYNKYE